MRGLRGGGVRTEGERGRRTYLIVSIVKVSRYLLCYAGVEKCMDL